MTYTNSKQNFCGVSKEIPILSDIERFPPNQISLIDEWYNNIFMILYSNREHIPINIYRELK